MSEFTDAELLKKIYKKYAEIKQIEKEVELLLAEAEKRNLI
jgi:hypothetical protein